MASILPFAGSGDSMVMTGLVGYWDAANPRSYPGSGTTWSDLSGNGLNGTMTGVTYTGGAGAYMTFDGLTSIVDCGTSSLLNLTNFTLEAMVYTVNAGENNLARIIDRNALSTVGYQLWLNDTAAADGIKAINVSSFTPETKIYVNNSLSYSTWQHYVATLSGTTGTLYLNGSSIGTNASMTVPTSGTANFYIGNRAAADRTFNGRIALIRVYNRALSSIEINKNFYSVRIRYGI